MLRFLTCGESHGPTLVSILDGVPAGLPLKVEAINEDLWRRQQGYGRGNRQKIEKDRVEIIGGVRHGITTGAPVGMIIRNRDFENWQHVMSVEPVDNADPAVVEQMDKKAINRFRPGHADLAGTFKYRQHDIRDVLERASARETASRVAGGGVARQILNYLNIQVVSHVVQVGSVRASGVDPDVTLSELDRRVLESEMFCADPKATEEMKELIKSTWQEGDSLGGVVEVIAEGLPVGLGSYTQWDRRLDGLLGQALLSIQAFKAVEIGDGVSASSDLGSHVHDPLFPSAPGSRLPFSRKSNRAGGLEGGMTNGERLCVRAYMKPIPTIRCGLESINFPEFAADRAHYERSDVCAIAAASVVCKAMVCLVLANSVLDKFGGDNIDDLKKSFDEYEKFCRSPKFAGYELAKAQMVTEVAEVTLEPQGNEDAVGEF
jgi:chorismate synthase